MGFRFCAFASRMIVNKIVRTRCCAPRILCRVFHRVNLDESAAFGRHPITMKITLIGGPTALLEVDGMRLLTDPTFDPPGSEFTTGPVTLRKTLGPALSASQIEPIDAILLSHDQHFDNLDRSGREFVARRRVLTTPSATARLGNQSEGLAPWQSTRVVSASQSVALTITATPARHGPPGIEPFSGEVTGFVVQSESSHDESIYVTGDTVWFEGVAEVARRFPVSAVLLFAGAARVAARSTDHLTMDRNDAVATARAFPRARIFPVHHSGWEHFSENQDALIDAFAESGLTDRLQPLTEGVPVEFEP
jgi:L-ascorbate metabolism protein UlaG (beta-lactamase superfamily)